MRKAMIIRELVLLFSLAAGVAGAQDAVKVAPGHYKVLVENAQVRVIENTLKPGEKDVMHTHPSGWYYVTKPGTMKVVHDDGKSENWEAKAGEQGWMNAEGAHTSENVGTTTMGFVLVEVKGAPSTPAEVKKAEVEKKK
jgi:oxalate decarboxylase/phosphoglucose isomerase-like protein (cupin superfamily)